MKELISYFTDSTEQDKDMTPKQKFQFGLLLGTMCGIAGALVALL